MSLIKQWNVYFTYDPNQILHVYPRNKTCIQTFIEIDKGLYTHFHSGKTRDSLFSHLCKDKMWCTHTVDHNSGSYKLLIKAVSQTNFENIMLYQRHQTWRATHCATPLITHSRHRKIIGTENRPMVPKIWGEGVIDGWQTGYREAFWNNVDILLSQW